MVPGSPPAGSMRLPSRLCPPRASPGCNPDRAALLRAAMPRDGETDGHAAHSRLPRHPTSERPLPRRRSRRRSRQFQRLRQGASRFQDLLRREGKPGAGDPAPACRDGLVLRHRFGRRSRDGDGCRRAGRAHLLRQHHQEGARHRARLRARHPAVRGRLRRGGRQDRARRARRARVLPRADRRRRRRMAAVAQVRLRARRWPSTCCAMPGRSASTPMACRSMSARSRPTSTPGTARWRTPSVCSPRWPTRASCSGWSTWAAVSRPATSGTCRRRRPTARRSSRRCASISATTSRRPSSSRAAAWSAMPASSSRRSC